MEQFWAFLKKEFWHILRDKRTMLILLVMPVVLIVLFGYAVTTEVKNTRVARTRPGERRGYGTRHRAHRCQPLLLTLGTGRLHGRWSTTSSRRGEADLAVVFGEDFATGTEQPSVQILADGSRTPTRPPCARATCSRSWPGACLRQAKRPAIRPRRAGVAIVTRLLYNPQSRSEYNFVPGVIGLILMLICVMMTSISIVREKRRGQWKCMLASPLCRPPASCWPSWCPTSSFPASNLATILLLSVSVLHIPVAGSLPGLVGVLAALHPGVALPRPAHLDGRSQPTGGHAAVVADDCPGHLPLRHHVPGGEYAQALQYVSAVVPTRWYVEAARRLMIQGVPMAYVAREALVLLLMAVALPCVAWRMFKIRLE